MRISAAASGKLPGNSRAFTLAEVVVGVAVMSVAFVSLYLGMSGGFAITQTARENLRATQIIIERMEGLRLYNWNQLVHSNASNGGLPTNFTSYYYPNGLASGTNKGVRYDGTMRWGPASLSPSASYADKMRSITVTVTWTSGVRSRTNTMWSYVSQYGIQNYVFSN
ncbi:MAG: hypothetical protein EPO07_10450 [Verrucomicrobia bacterium]|nr:MAG: hypothetical protein EPO07_10450 [Verrucomicrobiota bacterium]